MNSSITVVIHTRNEEKNIKESVQSAKILANTILIVDMESTDKTVTFAKEVDTTIKTFPFSHYVEPARAFGIQSAKTDWVFILDADERMTKELADEIKTVISRQSSDIGKTDFNKPTTENRQLKTYYKVPRKNIFGKNKWLKHGGWWPDYQIRLFYKSALIDWPKQIHSTPKFTGSERKLKNPIIHYFHGDLKSMVDKTLIFEDIESDLLYKAHKKTGTVIFLRKFLGELYRRLIKHRGFLDGTVGIIESIYQAYSKTITYIFLYEKQQSDDSKKSSTL